MVYYHGKSGLPLGAGIIAISSSLMYFEKHECIELLITIQYRISILVQTHTLKKYPTSISTNMYTPQNPVRLTSA
jgi:hypothetical protein